MVLGFKRRADKGEKDSLYRSKEIKQGEINCYNKSIMCPKKSYMALKDRKCSEERSYTGKMT